MANPAFQLLGDQFDESGAFGTDPYDTAPFGGEEWPPYELPIYHLGSDDLQQDHREKTTEVTHYRHGVPISIRPYGLSATSWNVNFAVILEAQLPLIKVFFNARIFYLLPNGLTTERVRIHWVETDFSPVYISPGVYSLAFSIQEYPE